ncbi:hypothetical protein ACKFKF_05010 [Phormidesmis sp. 146-12]
MTLKELQAQLLSLSPSEKAEAIQILTRSLSSNWRGITKTPGVCGATLASKERAFQSGCW